MSIVTQKINSKAVQRQLEQGRHRFFGTYDLKYITGIFTKVHDNMREYFSLTGASKKGFIAEETKKVSDYKALLNKYSIQNQETEEIEFALSEYLDCVEHIAPPGSSEQDLHIEFVWQLRKLEFNRPKEEGYEYGLIELNSLKIQYRHDWQLHKRTWPLDHEVQYLDFIAIPTAIKKIKSDDYTKLTAWQKIQFDHYLKWLHKLKAEVSTTERHAGTTKSRNNKSSLLRPLFVSDDAFDKGIGAIRKVIVGANQKFIKPKYHNVYTAFEVLSKKELLLYETKKTPFATALGDYIGDQVSDKKISEASIEYKVQIASLLEAVINGG